MTNSQMTNMILDTIKDNAAVGFNSYEQAIINKLRGVNDSTDDHIIYVTEMASLMPSLSNRATAAWLRNRIQELMTSVDLLESDTLS